MKRNKILIFPMAVIGLSACAGAEDAPEVAQGTAAAVSLQPAPTMCLMPRVNVDPRRSLTVTDHNILIPAQGGRDFSLTRVLTQLSNQSANGSPSALTMFKQLWDTQNPAPGLGLGFNCATSGGTPSVVNGFNYGCRAAEGTQATTNPATALANYEAVALVNRFDLAPADGSHCGEYRIVFENGRNVSSRSFLIMEAVLPNPNPSCGIAACRPVQQWWANLTTITDPAIRAQKLEEFYFTGISGFEPVVHYTHFLDNGVSCGYGCTTPGATGQFRTNTFMQSPWMLKEFKLKRTCRRVTIEPIPIRTAALAVDDGSTSLNAASTTDTTIVCDLDFKPVSVKDNPFNDFFNAASTHPLASAFVDHIDDQVACLAINDVNGFGYCGLDDQFNHNESGALASPTTDYRTIFNASPNNPSALRTSIQGALTAIGSSLTVENIVARAEAQSCKGCHRHASDANLGGGIIFPNSDSGGFGFVHNTEQVESGPDGLRFHISPALTDVFLPFRESVMEGYLTRSACVSCGDVVLDSAEKASTTVTAGTSLRISGTRAIH